MRIVVALLGTARHRAVIAEATFATPCKHAVCSFHSDLYTAQATTILNALRIPSDVFPEEVGLRLARLFRLDMVGVLDSWTKPVVAGNVHELPGFAVLASFQTKAAA